MNADVSTLLAELERRGYIESRIGPNGKEWRVTDAGRSALAELPEGASAKPGNRAARRARRAARDSDAALVRVLETMSKR